MGRERILYILFTCGIAALLYVFAVPSLLYILVLLLALPVCGHILLLRDAEQLEISLELPGGKRRGMEQPLVFKTRCRHRLLVAQEVEAELRLRSRTFGTESTECFHFSVSHGEERFCFPVPAAHCGVLEVECLSLRTWDLLRIFSRPLSALPKQQVMILPAVRQLEATLSEKLIGFPAGDGLVQHRMGADRSEVYDLRQYQPGDDVRSIHWKLSGKLDELVLRLPGDPIRYELAVLPDIGLYQNGSAISGEALEAAFSYGEALCGELLRLHVRFCMLQMSPQGICLGEIRTEQDFRQQLLLWLSRPLPEESGTLFRYFKLAHLEEQFSRLVVLSADGYSRELESLTEEIAVTVLNTSEKAETVSAEKLGSSSELLVLPVQQEAGRRYRIRC